MNISGQIRSVRGHRRKPLMYVHVNITEADQPEEIRERKASHLPAPESSASVPVCSGSSVATEV